jgi:ribosomal protein L7Ae-like RNA K-turn-binding protein
MDLQRLKGLLTLTHRAGKLHFGLENAKMLTSKGYKGFIVFADDLSPRTERELEFISRKGYNIYKLKVDKKTLGSWFGKDTVGVIFLPNTRLTFKIENLLLEGEGGISHPRAGRETKSKEVKQLETKGIRRAVRNRLQKIEKNFEGRFRFKRSRQYKGYGRPQTDDRPGGGGSERASAARRGGKRGKSG